MSKKNEVTDEFRYNMESHDLLSDRIEKLKDICPELFVEGQIDPERIKKYFLQDDLLEQERFELTWPGKTEVIRSLREGSIGTLAPDKNQSVRFDDSENIIIEGDNLEVLKLLQHNYHGKIKMIYIDPPYNTGNDFIYPDNYKEGIETYLRYSGQLNGENYVASTSNETNGRYHSKWLSMMFPRLFFARNLLRNDGIIYVSISHHELHNLRLIMNEIFGEENFIENIIWRKKSGGGQQDDYLVNEHEYIVCYARQKSDFNFNVIKAPLRKNDFKLFDNDCGKNYKLVKLEKWGAGALKEDRPTMYDFPELVDPDGNQSYPIAPDGRPGRWRYGHSKTKELIKENAIDWKKKDERWIPYEKVYEPDEDDGQILKERSIFYDLVENTEGSNELKDIFGYKDVFQNPKPSDLIAHLVYLSTSDNDIILDFFAGSGSTAHGVLKINDKENSNRKFILVQLPETIETEKKENTTAKDLGFKRISEITRDRVKEMIKKKMFNNISDAGFKYFYFTSSNFRLWDNNIKINDGKKMAEQLKLYENNVLPYNNVESVLYEIILKFGLSLAVKVNQQNIEGKSVFIIGDDAMAVCLEKTISEKALEGILELRPEIIVILDNAFEGNDQLKTNFKLQVESTESTRKTRIKFNTV